MIQGEVSTFLSALGSSEGDPRLQRALEAVGDEYETEIFDDGGVEDTYLSMPERGVEFLLTDGKLSTVFFYAKESDEQSVYGGWATLIDGVGVGSSPDDVRRALGEPSRSTSTYLTYQAGEGFVQLDFEGDSLKLAVVMGQLIGGPGAAG